MNQWRQSKAYRCPTCGATYLRDWGYARARYECPLRPMPKKRMARLVDKAYEQTAVRWTGPQRP